MSDTINQKQTNIENAVTFKPREAVEVMSNSEVQAAEIIYSATLPNALSDENDDNVDEIFLSRFQSEYEPSYLDDYPEAGTIEWDILMESRKNAEEKADENYDQYIKMLENN